MTILQSLNNAYTRLAARGEVAPFGYSPEKISYAISIDNDGYVQGLPFDLRAHSGKRPIARELRVPVAFKRSGVTPTPYFLSDFSQHLLGLGPDGEETPRKFENFKSHHLAAIGNSTDIGLNALKQFLSRWRPESFSDLSWPSEMLGTKIVFCLESERLERFLHERAASIELWAQQKARWEAGKNLAIAQVPCLVTGQVSEIARLHPPIKGLRAQGAQKDSDSIVSFNKDAFTSYGHDRGENAPVSEQAAFGYTTALNYFLRRGEGERHPNKIQVGDTNVVFWAEALNQELVGEAESAFPAFFLGPPNEQSEAKKIGNVLDAIRSGTIDNLVPNLQHGVTFNILGLAPNAARLSIRFWLQDSFGSFVANYQRFLSDMALLPIDKRDPHPPLWRLLCETAIMGDSKKVSPLLAGEWLRAILTGTRYPQTLLSAILIRIRADGGSGKCDENRDVGHISTKRVSILRSFLIRNFGYNEKEAPMAFDPENEDRGYLLGRLFATYVKIQEVALGNVNSSVKDKYYSSASAQPQKTFIVIDNNSIHHLAKIRKDSDKRKAGFGHFLAGTIGKIKDKMSPDGNPFPAALSLSEQCLFGLGYYHQYNDLSKSRSETAAATEDA